MECAFEDVESEDDEAEDGGGIAVAASFWEAPHPDPLPIGWGEGGATAKSNLCADIEIGDGQAECDQCEKWIAEPRDEQRRAPNRHDHAEVIEALA
jgi:hypothetical protein